MAVNLSPIWGAGAQLLDNSGNVLSGGKIYTYAAGTTTQVATYTSNTGGTANSNPIVLNSAGRVPYEIWLTDGQNYKFVLKDSNDVLIGTWDNLSGINSNFVAYTNQQEIQTATAGQTVFNLTTMNYLVGTNSLSVFVDGVNQYGPGAQYAYEETDSNTVTFASGLHVGAEVKFTSTQTQNAGVIDASQVGYTYPATNAVPESVEDRLAQYVSVKDFGAVGDGTADDTTAINNALASVGAGGTLYFPTGSYKITSTINLPQDINLVGSGSRSTTIDISGLATTNTAGFYVFGDLNSITGFQFVGGNGNVSYGIGIKAYNAYVSTYQDLYFVNCNYGMYLDEAGGCCILNCRFNNCLIGTFCGGGSGYNFYNCSFSWGCDTGIKVDVSPTTGYETGISAYGCTFTAATGFLVSRAAHTLSIDNCYFEGDALPASACRPFSIAQSGASGTLNRVSIQNCQIAHTQCLPSLISNVYQLLITANFWGQPIQVDSSVETATFLNNSYYLDVYRVNNSVKPNNLDRSIFSPWRITTLWFDNTSETAAILADGSGNGTRVSADRFIPTGDGVALLGDNVHRWSTVYATTGTINTSDANEKSEIIDLSNAEKQVAQKLKSQIKRFKFNDAILNKGDKARYHFGVIAQEVKSAFESEGLVAEEYGVFCSDALEDGGVRLGVRYDELLAFIIGSL